jgi:hypothetical protein
MEEFAFFLMVVFGFLIFGIIRDAFIVLFRAAFIGTILLCLWGLIAWLGAVPVLTTIIAISAWCAWLHIRDKREMRRRRKAIDLKIAEVNRRQELIPVGERAERQPLPTDYLR